MSDYTLFSTNIGECGLIWSEIGVTHLLLPEDSVEELKARAQEITGQKKACGVLPEWIQHACMTVQEFLRGKDADLLSIPLDLTKISPFCLKVYAAARKIPKGKTVSYKELAEAIGSPHSARAVGQALGRNPIALLIPCHRILGAKGALCGFSAGGGLALKQRLLTLEAFQR